MDRAMRTERKRALVDMTKDGNQEGVMDSLLEALQTGSAFSRDQRRKRQQRPRVDGGKLLIVSLYFYNQIIVFLFILKEIGLLHILVDPCSKTIPPSIEKYWKMF